MSFLPGFEKYRTSEAEERLIEEKFTLVARDVHIHLGGKISISEKFAGHSGGIYFLLVRVDQKRYKTYIGRTNSLERRMREYTNHFQPQSPNDFKMRAFCVFLEREMPGAALDLYFHPLPEILLKAAESSAINSYRPLLNEVSRPSSEARQNLETAYANFVISTFEERLLR